MSLEIELGVTGGEEDGIGAAYDGDAADNDRLYTQPESSYLLVRRRAIDLSTATVLRE